MYNYCTCIYISKYIRVQHGAVGLVQGEGSERAESLLPHREGGVQAALIHHIHILGEREYKHEFILHNIFVHVYSFVLTALISRNRLVYIATTKVIVHCINAVTKLEQLYSKLHWSAKVWLLHVAERLRGIK